MKKFALVFCSIFLLVSLLAIYPSVIAFAQDEKSEPPEEKIEISLTYPKLEATAGNIFEFEAQFRYTGEKERQFELKATGPAGWNTYITPSYETAKKILSMTVKPSFTYGDRIRIVASPPTWPLPEAKAYPITLEASSGELKATAEMTAQITALYYMKAIPTLQLYNTTATAGKSSFFSMTVQNQGTAAIDNITFSTTKPDGWTIDFNPEKIETLEAFSDQTVDLNIKPPPKTIAGDYMISLRPSGKEATGDSVDIRVTVETPTIWGWVGVGIILLVVVGLVVIFMRFSRR